MRGWARGVLATLLSPPWRRAPWLLWRRPGVMAMVAGAGLVLVTPIAAVPLFLSSVATASIAVQAAERCPRDTGVRYTAPVPSRELSFTRSDPLRPLADELGPVTRWSRSEPVRLAGPDPDDDTAAVVLARDGAIERIDVIAGGQAPGAWITDRAARATGLGPGDVATIDGAALRVAGVYRDLAGTTVDDYWCAHGDLLLPSQIGQDWTLPPPVVLVDRPALARLMADLGVDRVGLTWEAPLRDGLTVTDAEGLIDDLACGSRTAPELDWCAEGPATAELRYDGEEDFVAGFFGTHLPFVVDRAGSIRTSVAGGVWPVAGCATLAGVGFVAAAGWLWFDRRRREVRLLTVRGVSPAALGVKAVLELVVPLAAGAVAGVGLAWALVAWLGPSSVLEGSAMARAVVSGALGLTVAILVVGVVAARRARSGTAMAAPMTRRRWLAWLRRGPWELALVAVAAVSHRRLDEWGVPVSSGARVSRVDPLGLLFPVVFLLAAVAVAARLMGLAVGPLRAASRSWPTPVYLAVRRVARSRVAVVGLVAASAVAAGTLGYAATLNQSLETGLETKARVFVGSDVAVRLGYEERVPDELAARATVVETYTRAWVDAGAGERDASLVAIDPATFDDAAFWDPALSGSGLGDILQRLDRPAGDGPVPVVVTGMDGLPDTAELVVRDVRTRRFAIDQVADVRAFPGMRRQSPTVFAAARNVDRSDLGGGRTEAWIRGDREPVLAALDAAGTRYVETRRASEVADRAAFLTVAWTFEFMQALAVAAGLLVLGGLAAYLDARRRSRLLGYAFARRMGLTPAQHRRALLAELVASVVVGCWLGLGVALAGAWLAHGHVDPVPGFRPGPSLRPATAVFAALAATALVVAGLAAAVAQRRIDRDDPVEVLRAGA